MLVDVCIIASFRTVSLVSTSFAVIIKSVIFQAWNELSFNTPSTAFSHIRVVCFLNSVGEILLLVTKESPSFRDCNIGEGILCQKAWIMEIAVQAVA